MLLRCGSHDLDLSKPIVMGILNVTPDSFSDGGQWLDHDAAIAHAVDMVEQGASIVDVGGESTRPGATVVSEEEELRRVLPIVKALASRIQVPISVDTSRAAVIRAVCAAGATFINDVRGLSDASALQAAAESNAAVCLMHMQGEPSGMQAAPAYRDVVAEVVEYLALRIAACRNAGIGTNRIVIDPGIGFGKRLEHNLALLGQLRRLASLNMPILIGASRKSLIGAITGRAIDDRLNGSLAFATAAVLAGASIIRAHDVGPTVDAVKIATALRAAGQ
jgi:dihydropteroate synthase